jgi:hypothetical protein
MRGDRLKGGSRPATGRTLERRTPRELASLGLALPARVKAQELRLVLPCGEFARYIKYKDNSMWVHCDGNITVPGGWIKLRRGKSHGRCEYETRLTRVRGEKAVKRVVKP